MPRPHYDCSMLFVISPAKSLDYDTPAPADLPVSHTRLRPRSAALIKLLKPLKTADLQALMDISEPLAELNRQRFKTWKNSPEAPGARQAMWAFDGDVYDGLQAKTLAQPDWHWAQTHVRMLSGLYGVLRPFDAMQPYRLEMGTGLANPEGASLYAFWGKKIAQTLNDDLAEAHANVEQPIVVNLASQEYFKSVDRRTLKAKVVDCVFEELRGDSYKVISFNAKRARGQMLRWAIDHRVQEAELLKDFNRNGYAFSQNASDSGRWVFRKKPAETFSTPI